MLWPRQDVLEAIQKTFVFPDSKHFVDMPMKANFDDTIVAYTRIHTHSPTLEQMKTFVVDNFLDAGSDMLVIDPHDWVDVPQDFLPSVQNIEMRQWALAIHALWRTLCRKVVIDAQSCPRKHTLIPLTKPVFVPGDRFRETYYWDTYWIVKGLLVSGMLESAHAVVNNLLDMLDMYGFVPNGARSYYVNRSQPPLLSQMVRCLHDATQEQALLVDALPLLLREHAYWTSGNKLLAVASSTGVVHSLARYYADWYQPRPESYREDVALVHEAGCTDLADAAQLYCEIATAAESGWDFSSRWFADSANMETVRATRVVPADLNAFLHQMERNIAHFAGLLGQDEVRERFEEAAERRRAAMQDVMWDQEAGCWLDLILQDQDVDSGTWTAAPNRQPFASNWVPLWCGCAASVDQGKAAVEGLRASGLVMAAGVVTSLNQTGQQWDYPNAWAPIQHMLVEGMHRGCGKPGKDLVVQLASIWIQTNWETYRHTGHMHEKYNAAVLGGVGGGGEYLPQTGFGWTNGVALDLLHQFAHECEEWHGQHLN